MINGNHLRECNYYAWKQHACVLYDSRVRVQSFAPKHFILPQLKSQPYTWTFAIFIRENIELIWGLIEPCRIDEIAVKGIRNQWDSKSIHYNING